jgi:hypothetical protein
MIAAPEPEVVNNSENDSENDEFSSKKDVKE